MLMFDIGANRGDAVIAGLQKGYKVIALEPAPRVYKELISNFIYNENVIPLKLAVSDLYGKEIEFYECVEDGLSTTNKDWLTNPNMPYYNKSFRTIKTSCITVDALVNKYGVPDLIKIDVEGAEWSVFKGLKHKYGTITFEWTEDTIQEHNDQLKYLESIGYRYVAPQFIVNHLEEPTEWFLIKNFKLDEWVLNNKTNWESGGWKVANLRKTADVGMCWVK